MASAITAIIAAISIIAVVVMSRRQVKRAEGFTIAAERETRAVTNRLQQAQHMLSGSVLLKVSDWGEDFTGEGDVLPRYRWVVTTFNVMLEHEETLMIGNEVSYPLAVHKAMMWIEDHQNPVQVVVAPYGPPTLERPPTADHPLVDGTNS